MLKDAKTRELHYKANLLYWMIENSNKIPKEYISEIVKYLIENMADKNHQDDIGNTAL